MKNAHEFDGLYDDLFDFSKAGYAMIDVGMPWQEFPIGLAQFGYVSDDPALYWMKGIITKWHVTARGPLDPRVRVKHCEQVLEAVELPERLTLGAIEVFPSPYPEQDYDCVVVRVEDAYLYDINKQLAVLPGVQTYIPYKPHLTLGYFESRHTNKVLSGIRDNLNASVEVLGYDFGRMQP